MEPHAADQDMTGTRQAALRARFARLRAGALFCYRLSCAAQPSFCPSRSAQGFHQIDDVRAAFFLCRRLDGLAGGLALDELAQRELVLVLELRGVEAAGLPIEDVAGKLDHLLGDARARDALEDLLLVADLVVVAQRGAEHALAPGLDGQDVLAVGEHDARQRRGPCPSWHRG